MKVGADYVWTDGSIVKYTNWAPSQPDSGECVRMMQTTSYMWTDGNICNGLFSYICKIGKSNTVTIHIKVTQHAA